MKTAIERVSGSSAMCPITRPTSITASLPVVTMCDSPIPCLWAYWWVSVPTAPLWEMTARLPGRMGSGGVMVNTGVRRT